MAKEFLNELVDSLVPGERLCILPIARVLIHAPAWLSRSMAIFPPASVSPEWLRVVGWPERDYQRTLGSNSNGAVLRGDVLHWSKSGATRIDLPEFFASTLLALPLRLDWNAFLTPASHEMHLEMLASAMASAEAIMDLVRFELCNPWTPQTLPGRARLVAR